MIHKSEEEPTAQSFSNVEPDSQDYIRAEPLALSTAQKIVHFGQEDQSISTRAPSTTSTSETLWKQSPKSLPRFYSAGSNLVRSDRSRSDPKILLSVGRFLRKNGFRDINSKKSSFGGLFCTYPLHVAAEQNDQRMVSMLLHLGANPNQKDGRGRSPDECVKNKKTHVEVHNVLQQARGERKGSIPLRMKYSHWDVFFEHLERHPLARR